VVIDLNNVVAGTYQFAPRVTLAMSELRVESILPSSIEVVVGAGANADALPTPTRTPRSNMTSILQVLPVTPVHQASKIRFLNEMER
jgi:hypothetical protein